ncbi:oxygenase MpaB family protein [Gordonia sp. NPDC003376]
MAGRNGHRTSRAPTTLFDLVTTLGLTSGVANIIMQLSLPPVGYGVNESRVVSGSPRRHPMKRARTTGQYLVTAVIGTAADRDLMRAEIAAVHQAVVSGPDSPVRYSGNSPDLQKWVAACLFRFYLDQYTLLYGDLAEPELDVLTRAAEPLATGVNVRASAWPTSWSEFTRYWDSRLGELAIDPPVRDDFETLSNLEFIAEAWGPLGKPFPMLLGPTYRYLTRANLPADFRILMGWDWSERDARRFDRVKTVLRVADRFGGRAYVRTVYRLQLADFRIRARLGVPVLGPLRVSEVRIADGGAPRWITRRRPR